ncbi:acyltransferase [Sorangium cellulosum]|uniref:Acyltransferase n=1 Tax=Sorangium cellulosum TaxID=56 RepID=A0A2L0ESD9_SORCE|nr:acyltransferase [Sorangium cellulosum]AUX42227.1 acyltransferase [Sorangium cellulosum]
MKPTRLFTVLGAMLFPLAVVLASNGCKDEEELPPPVPSAPAAPTPAPTPTPTTAIVPEEDAGVDAADADVADADAGKKATGTPDPGGIRKCCAALRQNAKSAPPEQQGGYLAAASACDGLANSPQGRQALSTLRGLLLGAQMPASCQ